MAYDNRDDRYGRPRGNEPREHRAGNDDRGFFERGADEVRSWFGDDDAEHRRDRDGDGYHYDADNRGGRQEPDNRNAGFRGTWGREQGGGYNSRPDAPRGDYGARGGGDHNRDRGSPPHHDPDYRNWRDRQVASFDRDYEEYRRERQGRFHDDFESWRTNRNTQAGAEATGVQWRTKIRDHQEVLGSDGEHVGTVDHVQGDQIELSKRDGDGEHHYLPLTAIVSVDNAVRLNLLAADAKRQWRGDTAL